MTSRNPPSAGIFSPSIHRCFVVASRIGFTMGHADRPRPAAPVLLEHAGPSPRDRLLPRQATRSGCADAAGRMAAMRVRRPGPGEAAGARQVAAGRPDRRRSVAHSPRPSPWTRSRPASRRTRSPRCWWRPTTRVLGRAGRPRCGHDPRRRRDGPQRHAAPVRRRGATTLAGARARSRSRADLPALRAEDLDEALGAVASGATGVRRRRGRPRHHALHRAVRRVRPAVRPRLGAGARRDGARGDPAGAAAGCAATSTTSTTCDDALGARRRPRTANGPPPSGDGPSFELGQRFFAAFFAGAFLAGAFLAGAFLAGAFFAAPSWPEPSSRPSWPEPSWRGLLRGLLGRSLLGGSLLRGLLGRRLLRGAFFAAFLAGAFLAGPSWPSPSWQRPSSQRPSSPAPSSRPSWQSSWSSSSSPGRQRRPPSDWSCGLDRELRQLLGARDDVLQVLARQ